MPLYKSINVNSHTVIKIWKITETYDDLIKPLTLKTESIERVSNMKSEIHRCGFLSVRHLLMENGYSDMDLYYDDNGKPHLKDGKYISITHSFIFSGVIVSNSPVGIDIEKQREKIGIIAHKFIDFERMFLNKNALEYIRQLTIIWCIKESLYKLFATPGLSFKNNTLVIPFITDHSNTVAWIDYLDKKYRFLASFLEFEGFTCAFVVD